MSFERQIILYHNPNCSKSCEALRITLPSSVQVRNFIEQPLSSEELKTLLSQLHMKAEDLIRKKENLFQTEYAGKSLTEYDFFNLLQQHPSLMERPIISDGKKAIVARPPVKAVEFISSLTT